MTGPYAAIACIVEDTHGEPVCRCYRRSDAVRIAADLNLADSLIVALGVRPRSKVVKFNLDNIAPEDRFDVVESVYGESIERGKR